MDVMRCTSLSRVCGDFQHPRFLRDLLWTCPSSMADFPLLVLCLDYVQAINPGSGIYFSDSAVTGSLWQTLLSTPRFPRTEIKVVYFVYRTA
jgi:hypothetical protein